MYDKYDLVISAAEIPPIAEIPPVLHACILGECNVTKSQFLIFITEKDF